MTEILEHLKRNASDVEMQALLQESANTAPNSHPVRGFTILNNETGVETVQVINTFSHFF